MQVNNICLSHKADFQKINLLDERTGFPKWHTEIIIFLNIRMLSLCVFFLLLCILSFVSFHCSYLSTLLMPANHALATQSIKLQTLEAWPCARALTEALFSISHWKNTCLVMAICLKILLWAIKSLISSSRNPSDFWVGCELQGEQKLPCRVLFDPKHH